MIDSLHSAIAAFSAKLGADPLLVQGAGGNISWKTNDALWIKASGTQLAQALTREIFVPLDLAAVRAGVAQGLENFAHTTRGTNDLRPSIETALHALMPQRIVVHMHAVDVLAYAVQQNGEALLAEKLGGLPWAWVPYVKPGAALANAVGAALARRSDASVLVLGNHGLVIGGETIADIETQLKALLQTLRKTPAVAAATMSAPPAAPVLQRWTAAGYALPKQPALHALGRDARYRAIAAAHWVMYPDHAVFLGAEAPLALVDETPALFAARHPGATCVLLPGEGVMLHQRMSIPQREMLVCYLHLLERLPEDAALSSLSLPQIAELLNWDAEKYRQQLAQSGA